MLYPEPRDDLERRHSRKPDSRRVVLAAENFEMAHAQAQKAMLHNWSNHPHVATVISIRPLVEGDGSHLEVVVP